MNKPLFKKLLGNRVYLTMPQIPETKIELSAETKKSLIDSEKEKLSRLTVYAVGDGVGTDIKEGDVVRVDTNALARAETISLSKDVTVLLVSVFDITMIW